MPAHEGLPEGDHKGRPYEDIPPGYSLYNLFPPPTRLPLRRGRRWRGLALGRDRPGLRLGLGLLGLGWLGRW